MKFEVLEEKDNPLLKRKELVLSLDFENSKTPSKSDLQAILSEKYAVEPEKVDVTKLFSETGLAKGKAFVKIWENVPVKKKGDKAGGEGGQKAKEQKQA